MTTALSIIYGLGVLATSLAFIRMFWGDRELLGDEAGWLVIGFLGLCVLAWPIFWLWATVVVILDGDDE